MKSSNLYSPFIRMAAQSLRCLEIKKQAGIVVAAGVGAGQRACYHLRAVRDY
jgi:hypothetical protein